MYNTEIELFNQYKTISDLVSFLEKKETEIKNFFDNNFNKNILIIAFSSEYLTAAAIKESLEAEKSNNLEKNSISVLNLSNILSDPDKYKDLIKESIVFFITKDSCKDKTNTFFEIFKNINKNNFILINSSSDNKFDKIVGLSINIPFIEDKSLNSTKYTTSMFILIFILIKIKNKESFGDEFRKIIDIADKNLLKIRKPIFEKLDTISANKVIILDFFDRNFSSNKYVSDFIKMSRINIYQDNIIDFKYNTYNFVDDSILILILYPRNKKIVKEEIEIINMLQEKEINLIHITHDLYINDKKNLVLNIEDTNNNYFNDILFLNTIQVINFLKSLNLGENPDGSYNLRENNTI